MQQGAGAPEAGTSTGRPAPRCRPQPPLERLERLRADPRAVRADLEHVAEPARTAPRAAARSGTCRRPCAGLPARERRRHPGGPRRAGAGSADAPAGPCTWDRRRSGTTRRCLAAPRGARRDGRRRLAAPFGTLTVTKLPTRSASRNTSPSAIGAIGTAAPRIITAPGRLPRAIRRPAIAGRNDPRVHRGEKGGRDYHVGFGGGADGGARGRQAQRSAVPAPGELKPQRSWRLRGRRARGDRDRLGQRHRLGQRPVAAETDPVSRPQPGTAPPAAPNVAHIPPQTVLPSPWCRALSQRGGGDIRESALSQGG